MSARAPPSDAAKKAATAVLDDVLGNAEPMLIRALRGNAKGAEDDASKFLRTVTLKAASTMTDVAVASGKGEEVFTKLLSLLQAALSKGTESVVTGLLQVIGDLAGHLERASVKKMLVDTGALFDKEADAVRAAAVVAVASTLKVAIGKGSIKGEEEPTALLTSSLTTMKGAKTSAEARTAACGVGAAIGALGEAALVAHGVVDALNATFDTKSKEAPSAREAATMAFGLLCLALKYKFEPYSIPLLPKMVKAFVDKDKAVADAACKAALVQMENLSTLSVKSVIGALYEGMQVVGGGGRSRIECLGLVSTLAVRAPRNVGPCLHECIPIVMECLNDSNAKVQSAAETALPVLIACTENAEVAKTLKGVIIDALIKPDTTLACIEEVLMTTFCNPMDGTSLAFMMPLLIRGVKDANYALVKKATVCISNVCALVKEGSDVAPFVPIVQPLLEKNLDHSSPDIRDASTNARTKLLEGAGDLVDPTKRFKAIAESVTGGLTKLGLTGVSPAVLSYVGDSGSAMLEEKLGGVVRVQYFKDAVPMLTEWIVDNLGGYVSSLDKGALSGVAAAAVAVFTEMLSDAAKKILSESGDKDFAVDIQNIILAFAGRVLLRKADVRFERGHRYGLVGQNGTGKTTLLNRLAAKDIVGFPQNLKTWYIRHEVICDDGVDVRAYLKQLAPEEKVATGNVTKIVEDVLDSVQYPDELRSTFVNSLSGGWKMKLSVALSVLHEPELLLLDEPTNHLDPDAVQWLTNHLLNLEGVTMAIVSHEYDFIDDVCTDITHYDNNGQLGQPCRFVYYPMSFGKFQRLKPEVAAGLPRADHGPAASASESGSKQSESEASESAASSLAESMDKLSTADSNGSEMSTTLAKVDEMIAQGLIRPFIFPDPGKPEGIRTFRKPIMTLKNVNFKYTDKYIVKDCSATLTLGSRAVIVGGNGSGKSTVLKLIIGDLEAEEGVGEAWKHHNLRQAYVAQQSLHHLEDFVQVTPIHYIQERFRQGLDSELSKLKTTTITDEDQESMKGAGAITEIVGRQQKGKNMWYEVKKNGRVASDTQWFPQAELEMGKAYVKKLIKNFDMKQQALDSGMAIRPITAAEILKHLEDFGIDSMLAHGKIRQMSGGQRQRLVICAAFWSKPHVIALDEPTNYLDNDSVAALTKALKDFKGAVLAVSENEAFTSEISNEKWVVENGSVSIVQIRDAKAR